MQVGDLVMWTYPGAEDVGLVLELSDSLGGFARPTHAYVQWTTNPEHSGEYLVTHKHLEVVNECR